MGMAPVRSLPGLTLSYPHSHARISLAVAASALLFQGCFTPPELRDRADRDAYALIDARRKQLFDQDTPFSLPAPTASFGREPRDAADWTMREKVLAGAVTGVGPLNVGLGALDRGGEQRGRSAAAGVALPHFAGPHP